MNFYVALAFVIGISGAFLSAFIEYQNRRYGQNIANTTVNDSIAYQDDDIIEPAYPKSSGGPVLLIFSIAVLIYALSVIIHYWKEILMNLDKVYFGCGLFITMAGGMLIQVITSNYKDGERLFNVSSSQLLYPLLFSAVVFYPIWAISQTSQTAFSFYSAFLSGYFWQNAVSTVKKNRGVR